MQFGTNLSSSICAPAIKEPVTLEYFPLMGRTEPLRMICGYSGIAYKDVSVDWGNLKGKAPYQTGGLPHAIVNGMRFQETVPIARMLAAAGGMYNHADPCSTHWCDFVMDDMNNMLSGIGFMLGAQDAGKW